MDAELVAWRERVGACADSQLMAELQKLVRFDRRCEVRMLMYLAEVDERELFLEQGFSSLFGYATDVLRMSQAQAYLRMQAARLARRFPVILDMLVQGELNLSTLKLLDRHLTVNNHMALLDRARNKTKREVELLVAEIAPRPDVPTRMRKLPAPRASKQENAAQEPSASQEILFAPATGGAEQQAPVEQDHVACGVEDAGRASVVAPGKAEINQRASMTFVSEAPRASCNPLGPGRFDLRMTAGQSLHDKLRQLQHLLRHQVPGGNLAVIVERACDVLIEMTLRRRFAQVAKPRLSAGKRRGVSSSECVEQQSAAAAVRAKASTIAEAAGASSETGVQAEPAAPAAAVRVRVRKPGRRKNRSRYIPRYVVREVFARYGDQCTFVGTNGHRCTEHGMLELHHLCAFALGGEATVENLKFVCRSHNWFYAIQDFGAAHMRRKRAASRSRRAHTKL